MSFIHTIAEDEIYKLKLSNRIQDLVHVEPIAYDVVDLEHIVDCVHELRDILSCDDGNPVDHHHMRPSLEYIHRDIDYSHYFPEEIEYMIAVHDRLRKLIEN